MKHAPEVNHILYGRWRVDLADGSMPRTLKSAELLEKSIAEAASAGAHPIPRAPTSRPPTDSLDKVVAMRAMSVTLFWTGRILEADDYAQRGMNQPPLSTSRMHLLLTDPRAICRSVHGMASWQLGYPVRALA